MLVWLALLLAGAEGLRPDSFPDNDLPGRTAGVADGVAVPSSATLSGAEVAALREMEGSGRMPSGRSQENFNNLVSTSEDLQLNTSSEGAEKVPHDYTASKLGVACSESNMCNSCRSFQCGNCQGGCQDQSAAQACCDADSSCKAIYGGGSHWWSFHKECTVIDHPNHYVVCLKDAAGGYSCTDKNFKCKDTPICPGRNCRDFECGGCGSKCTTRDEAIECCEKKETCTAAYGGGEHWWTYDAQCTEDNHFNYYTTYHKPTAAR